MDSDKKFLVEKLAEYAERNRLTLGEIERLLRLCLQLEQTVPACNLSSMRQRLQCGAISPTSSAITKRSEIAQGKFTKSLTSGHERRKGPTESCQVRVRSQHPFVRPTFFFAWSKDLSGWIEKAEQQ